MILSRLLVVVMILIFSGCYTTVRMKAGEEVQKPVSETAQSMDSTASRLVYHNTDQYESREEYVPDSTILLLYATSLHFMHSNQLEKNDSLIAAIQRSLEAAWKLEPYFYHVPAPWSKNKIVVELMREYHSPSASVLDSLELIFKEAGLTAAKGLNSYNYLEYVRSSDHNLYYVCNKLKRSHFIRDAAPLNNGMTCGHRHYNDIYLQIHRGKHIYRFVHGYLAPKLVTIYVEDGQAQTQKTWLANKGLERTHMQGSAERK